MAHDIDHRTADHQHRSEYLAPAEGFVEQKRRRGDADHGLQGKDQADPVGGRYLALHSKHAGDRLCRGADRGAS